jgi:hypothetical protein
LREGFFFYLKETRRMNKYLASAALIGAFGLGGCAIDPTYQTVSAKTVEEGDAEVLTGTRLARPTTERLLRRVGNKDYKDEQIKSLHNDGKPSN